MTSIKSTRQVFRIGSPGVVVASIMGITPEDIPIVDYPGNPAGPMEARVATDLPSCHPDDWPPVLLAFENGDPLLPIVVGLVRRSVKPKPAAPVRKLLFDAEEEVLLQCGKSSILLRRDGKIVIKGGNIVSRASGTNKVQGGAVRLN
jgi:Domain of unknown function (DUF6484)